MISTCSSHLPTVVGCFPNPSPWKYIPKSPLYLSFQLVLVTVRHSLRRLEENRTGIQSISPPFSLLQVVHHAIAVSPPYKSALCYNMPLCQACPPPKGNSWALVTSTPNFLSLTLKVEAMSSSFQSLCCLFQHLCYYFFTLSFF